MPVALMNYLVKCPCGHTIEAHCGDHHGCQEQHCRCMLSSVDVINGVIWSVSARPGEPPDAVRSGGAVRSRTVRL